MERRSTVAFLVVLAAASSILVMLLEHRRPPASIDDKPIMVIVLRGNVGDMARLAVMSHDLSLAGLSNRSGHWYSFPGHEHLPNLPFGNSYRDLIGGLANLPNLPLGQPATLQATGTLSSYSPLAAADGSGIENLKRALAVLTVTTSEGKRLLPVRDALTEGWVSGEARVAVEHLPYIEHWDTICYELLRANKNGVWDGPFTELLRVHTNIKSKEEALAVVGVIANRTLQGVLMARTRRA